MLKKMAIKLSLRTSWFLVFVIEIAAASVEQLNMKTTLMIKMGEIAIIAWKTLLRDNTVQLLSTHYLMKSTSK
jgi:hypothetical protein